jgi:peptidylprolyl isomerase
MSRDGRAGRAFVSVYYLQEVRVAIAAKGDTVTVHYTGRIKDGTVFDTSRERGEPLEFTLGQGEMIQGFENAVLGMALDERRTVEIQPQEAYGPYREEMTAVIDRAELPPDLEPKLGQRLEVQHDSGSRMLVTVAEVTEKTIRLDANHPLAGQTLTFEIELISIA